MPNKISIIIPVYNVEKYIDRCLTSVTNQTYKNIEILIMEGQSTDGSLNKVKKWAAEDKRIKYVSRADGGLGPARNYAVSMSTGEWLLFVDSDDWIAEDFIEKCVGRIDNGVDIVIGNAKKIKDGNVIDNIGDEWDKEFIETEKDKIEYVCYASNFVWGKLIKKDYYVSCQIEQPALPFEDLAIFPTLILKANKIAICHEAIAYYEADREESLSQQFQAYRMVKSVYEYAKTLLEKNRIASKYERVLKYSFFVHGRIICIHCLDLENYKNGLFDYNTKLFLEALRPEGLRKRLLLYGGFTLRWTVQQMCCGDENIQGHIAFSTLISQMNPKQKNKDLQHENSFRKKSLNADVNSNLRHYVKVNNLELLLIDFAHELQDIIVSQNGELFSHSEILKESLDFNGQNIKDVFGEYRIIKCGSKEWFDLWKVSCKRFVDWINEESSLEVVLVRNQLAEKYTVNNEWSIYKDSAEGNEILERLYDYFLSLSPNCKVYEPNKKLIYTDMTGKDNYRNNREYMNISYYREMARRIQMNWIKVYE